MFDKNNSLEVNSKASLITPHKNLFFLINRKLNKTLGKTTDSKLVSAPEYTFGTAARTDTKKLYLSKKLSKSNQSQNNNPGPIYAIPSKFKFKISPEWSFNRRPKMGRPNSSYDHLYINDKLTSVLLAQNFARRKSTNPVFTTAERVTLLVWPEFNLQPEHNS